MADKQQDNLSLRGFLHKKGVKGPVKAWKKRWFVHSGKRIFYCRSADETAPLGAINIGSIISVHETQKESLKKEKGEWVFEVDTPGRTYTLAANNESTMRYWISSINRLVKEFKENTGTAGTPHPSVADENDQLTEKLQKELNALDLNSGTKGTLCLQIKCARDVTVPEGDIKGVYSIITIEKQQVKTNTNKPAKGVVDWNETFTFDITNLGQSRVVINLWAVDSANCGTFLGQVNQKLAALRYNQPLEESMKLAAVRPSQEVTGDILVRMDLTPLGKKVGMEDFDLLKVVGRGNFGKVMQVRKKDTGRIYAMKVIRKDAIIAADAVQHTLAEKNVLRMIHHPFIVSLKYSFQSGNKLYMILDYINGGELFFHLSNVDRFPEPRARFYTAEIILALGYLHTQNIVYRDLKPENLLLDMDGHIALTDFGLVKEGLGYGMVTHTFCGSPEYLAPEVLQGRGYGKAVDWWALGTFLYEMLEGLPPFYSEDVSEMNRRILRAPLHFDPAHFSPEARSLLEGLLERDPSRRLGAGPDDAEEIKRHPFFASINWTDLFERRVEPPTKPHLKTATDVSNFDPEFTNQIAMDSYTGAQISDANQMAFQGFSYVAPEESDYRKQSQARRAQLMQQRQNQS